jgi:isopentenyl diphosphate isomerase/L-lactate dehydrogenase-like FMN-dependent dehydrogenase
MRAESIVKLLIRRRLEGPLADSRGILNSAVSRRTVFRGLAGFLAGSPLFGQQDPFHDFSRVPALGEMLNAFDFEPVAHAKVAREAWDYLSWGVDGEFTMRRNREAFDWVELVSRGIAGAAPAQPASTLLGINLPFPILISPTARHVMFHRDAEAATHAGATAASNTPLVVSNVATLPVEKIAAAATGPWLFQLYPQPGPDYNRQTLEKAQTAGCRAVVVTVDQQASVYERQTHDRNLGTPLSPVLAPVNVGRRRPPGNPYRVPDGRLWYEWTLLDELRRMVKVPMLVKGIVTGEDARLCLEHGVDAIYVSNHGGRSLDYGPSTLEALPEIADAVQGRVPIIFDSGIRRGSDILKALALGASAVGVGRVPLWGLAAYGPQGLQKVLEILQAELVQAMTATGRPTLASIDRTLVRTEFL